MATASSSTALQHPITTFPGAGLPRLRVRTLRALPVRFCIDFGQRNAVFLKRPLTARSVAVWAESLAPVPEAMVK